MAAPALAQDVGRVYYGADSCGYRGPLVNATQQTHMVYWFAEGTAWTASPSVQIPYILAWNTRDQEQPIRVRAWVDGGRAHEIALVLKAQERYALDMGYWLRGEGEGETISFAAEVIFDSVGEASMVTWNKAYQSKQYQNPAPKCEGPILQNPYGGSK